MKITEIEWGTAKMYVDENGFEWTALDENLINDRLDRITNWYNLRGLMSIEFEEMVDWSKVEVDTPILVKQGECSKWEKRHFAKFEGGKVFAFHRGETSWSTTGNSFTWDFVKLGDSK